MREYRQLKARTENSKRTSNVNHFGLYLFCNDESDCDLWHVEQTTILRVINREDPDKNVQKTVLFNILILDFCDKLKNKEKPVFS